MVGVNIKVGIKVEVKGRMKQRLSWLRMVSKLRSKLRLRLVSSSGQRSISRLRSKSKSIFKLRKYKLNYLFKYSKSVVESGSIIITKPT